MEDKNHGEKLGNVNADIITIFILVDKNKWNNVKEASIYRIIYLASVMYSFIYPDNENPFKNDYNFIIELNGPYSDEIKKSIDFLMMRENIVKEKRTDLLTVSKNTPDKFDSIYNYKVKKEWLEIVINLLSIYGENKIYDFIFSDPEYQYNISINSTKTINIDNNNKTIEYLKKFQKEFENNIDEAKNRITPKKYLDFYFEYIFSKILKKEY